MATQERLLNGWTDSPRWTGMIQNSEVSETEALVPAPPIPLPSVAPGVGGWPLVWEVSCYRSLSVPSRPDPPLTNL